MTLLRDIDHLTRDPATNAGHFTYRGMAHFAGSGPARTCCRDCVHFGVNKAKRCQQFKKLTGRYGPPIPGDALSCRHFTETANARPGPETPARHHAIQPSLVPAERQSLPQGDG
jgi:hypothetical protein